MGLRLNNYLLKNFEVVALTSWLRESCWAQYPTCQFLIQNFTPAKHWAMHVNVSIICFCTLSYYLFSQTCFIFYVFIRETWKWLRCLASLWQQNSEKQTDMGGLGLNIVFRKVNRPCMNCDYNTVLSAHRLAPITYLRPSSLVTSAPPTTTIYQGTLQPGYQCGLTQLLREATSVVHISYQVKKI